MHIWLDGTLRQEAEVAVSPLSHTLHYGLGVFEGIRCYDGARGPMVFRLRDHLQRLESSTRLLEIAMPWDVPLLTAAVLETLRANGLGDAYIRPLVYYGSGGMGLDSRNHPVHTLIAAWRWDRYYPEAREAGLSVRIVSYRRLPGVSAPVQVKVTGNYLNSQLAAREAAHCGADAALLLDDRGYLAEGASENLFIVRSGCLYTPTSVNALEGITRDTVMRLARRLGRPVFEVQMTREDLYRADEAFFTGTACEIRRIARVDGKVLHNPAGTSVVSELSTAYRALVQADGRGLALLEASESGHWLTPVYGRAPAQPALTELRVADRGADEPLYEAP